MDADKHSTGINYNSSYSLLIKFGSCLYFTYKKITITHPCLPKSMKNLAGSIFKNAHLDSVLTLLTICTVLLKNFLSPQNTLGSIVNNEE